MTMPTDDLIIKAQTQTSNWSSLIDKLWADRIERNLRKQAMLVQTLTEFNNLEVPGSGDILHIPTLPDLTSVPALTEGTPMSVQAMPNSGDIDLTPTEYGMMYAVTRKMMDRIKYDGMAEIFDRFAYAMSQTMENQVAALYSANVPGTSGSGFSNGQIQKYYANGKTTSNITTSDVFNAALLLQGITQLKVNNAEDFGGWFHLYINPSQWSALHQDTTIVNNLRYADPSALLNGQVASLYGAKIFVTNYIQISNEGSGSAVPVNNALLLSPRWAAIAYKRRPAAFVDPTLYDGGRIRQFGISADFQIALFHNERAVVLASA